MDLVINLTSLRTVCKEDRTSAPSLDKPKLQLLVIYLVGGNENLSVFGVKSGIRALGFGPKSPVPRPSYESMNAYRGKLSIDTISSGSQSSNSRSAIQSVHHILFYLHDLMIFLVFKCIQT